MTGRIVRGPRRPLKRQGLSPTWEYAQDISDPSGIISPTKREQKIGCNVNRGFVNYFEPWATRPSRSKVVAAMVLRLQRNGVFVPRIKSVDFSENLVLFEYGGRTLEGRLLRGIPKKYSLRLLSKLFRVMGQVHALGVIHGHPHENNIVIRGNKLGLIDFKLSEVVPKSIWRQRATDIFNRFSVDYEYLAKNLEDSEALKANAVPLFARLFRRYPVPEPVKKELLQRLIESLRVWGRENWGREKLE